MEASASALRSRGLIHRLAEDTRLEGRQITLGGRSLVNFGSCSYLGLETDARLKAGACEAVLRYGTQFSSSRAYVGVPLHGEFQELLVKWWAACRRSSLRQPRSGTWRRCRC